MTNDNRNDVFNLIKAMMEQSLIHEIISVSLPWPGSKMIHGYLNTICTNVHSGVLENFKCFFCSDATQLDVFEKNIFG